MLDLGLERASSALSSQHGQDRVTHVPFPLTGVPRFLIPRHPAPVAAAAVRAATTGGPASARLLRRTGALLARVGIARLAPRAVALGGPGTFLDHLSEVLGQDLIASVHLGPPRANRKPVLNLMDRGGNSVAFVKLGVNELTCQRVRNETAALRRLAGTPTSGLVVPSLLAAGEWESLDYMVTSPVATESGRTSTREVRRAATNALVAAFPNSQAAVAQSPWWSRIMAGLDQCPDDPDVDTLRTAAARIVDRHDGTPVLQGAGHGDFSPWNVCAHQDHLVVWDWERFALDVPVGWDEIHFTLNSHRGGPAAALTLPEAALRLLLKDATTGPSELLAATYLLNFGVNFLVDRQREAGVRRGPLSEWLLPALLMLSGAAEE